jgi:hypothetical protein
MRFLKYFSLLILIQISLTAQTSLNQKIYNSLDSLIIDPDTIDINQFSILYKFWIELETSNPDLVGDIVVSDFNNNGFPELYSAIYSPSIVLNAVIFEPDSSGNFNIIYNYPDSVKWAIGKYDIDNDGTEELILSSWGSRGIFIYKQKDTNSYPLNLDFFFSINPEYQINNHTFGDFDKNGKTDYAFWADAFPRFLGIYEYNSLSNSFDSIFTYIPDEFSSGIIVGDFDNDGKTDIAFGSIDGKIVLIEAIENNKYEAVWLYETYLFNAYDLTSTEDFNNNNLTEFWVLGEDLNNFQTVLIGFESVGDNNYEPFFKIIFKNTSTFGYSRLLTKDINYDGHEELIVCIGNSIFFFNFAQIEQKVVANLFYYIKIENIGANSIDNTSFFDLENKGYLNLLVCYSNRYTKIYRFDGTSDIDENENISISNFNLKQNYPNPFNPSTNIKLLIPERSEVKIKVYNSLGEEIITLLNKTLERGEHTLVWNGINKNNNTVPSGVYFISMEAANFHKTIKSVLIK